MKEVFEHFVALVMTMTTILSSQALDTAVVPSVSASVPIHDVFSDFLKLLASLIIAVLSRFAFKWIDDHFQNRKKKSHEKIIKRD